MLGKIHLGGFLPVCLSIKPLAPRVKIQHMKKIHPSSSWGARIPSRWKMWVSKQKLCRDSSRFQSP